MNLCLLPAPRHLAFAAGRLNLAGAGIVLPPTPSADTLFATRRLQAALAAYTSLDGPLVADGSPFPPGQTPIRLRLDPSPAGPDAYSLTIAPAGITLASAGEPGLFYAVCTLIQILRQAGRALPCLHVADAPDFPHRGVMLDISRDKVPTLPTLFDLIDLLAAWKINQLQLYMEHTFAYAGHPEVWAAASPLTAAEIRQLDTFCRQRHIELVPNQNSFGHMERWLKHPAYRPLAEAPDGADTPWGFRWDGPFSLCPTDPRSLQLLEKLYDELLPNFSSRLFNVGCDETFDLGQGRSKSAADAHGKTRVYLNFLFQIHHLVRARNRTMMFWGDIILHQPQLIADLPKDLIALEWGYEADHPFDKDGAAFAAAGVPFYVCPGTSSWCSIAGRTDNCIANLKNAAEHGKRHGAIGYLNTDWGDHGHLQYLPISYLGFAAGAAYSWSLNANRDLNLPRALNIHAFLDSAGVMGQLAWDLGNVYQTLPPLANSSKLFWFIVTLRDRGNTDDVTLSQLDAALSAINAAIAPLPHAQMNRPDASLIAAEFTNAANLLRHAVHRARQLKTPTLPLHPPEIGAPSLPQLIAQHQTLWLARNRPGGLPDSVARLTTAASITA